MGRYAQRVIAGERSPESAPKLSYAERAKASLAAEPSPEVVEEAAFVEEPSRPAAIGQLLGRPIAAGAIEGVAAYSPAYAGLRGAASALEWLQSLGAGKARPADVIAGATPEQLELGRAAIEEVDPAGRLAAAVDLPVTLAKMGATAALGERLPEEHLSSRAERYMETAARTVGGARGLGAKALGLFSLSGPAAAATEEAMRRAGIDPELAQKTGTAVELGMAGADLVKGVRALMKDATLSPARRISALLGQSEVNIVSEAEQLAVSRGIPFEQARRDIEQAAQTAARRLGREYLPVYTQAVEELGEVGQALTPGGEGQRAVEKAAGALDQGQKQAVERAFTEIAKPLGEVRSSLAVGQELKSTLKAIAEETRKPISRMYKEWDSRFGKAMLPVSPERLLELDSEMQRVRSVIAAQRGQAIAAGDLLTANRLSDTLTDLAELEGHKVSASVGKVRQNITNLKRRLREAGIGEAEGLYGNAVGLLEGIMEEGLEALGHPEAVSELRRANDAWRAYAERFYTPTVAKVINESGDTLASAVRNSYREGNAADIRRALEDTEVKAWTRLGLDQTQTFTPAEQMATYRQLWGDPAKAEQAVTTLTTARDSVSLPSLQRARADLVRAYQRASGEERAALQRGLESLDRQIEIAGASVGDRRSLANLQEALRADEAVLQSDLARDIRSRIDTAASPDAMASIVEQAGGISPEAGSIARRKFIERLLLPKGAETTAREVASAYRKNKAAITRVLGETEISERDIHQIMGTVEKLKENVSKERFLLMKSGLLHEIFESAEAMADLSQVSR